MTGKEDVKSDNISNLYRSSCLSTMYGGYMNSPRPLSAQLPCTNDYESPRSSRRNGIGITHSRQICKYCADLVVEKSMLEHEIDLLENRNRKMLENKETEVSNRYSIILDDLHRENSLLKERLSVEERRRFSEIRSIPYDQEVCTRQRLERQLKRKENEVWDLKRSLKETKSKLNCLVEDLKKREYDTMKMKVKISEEERKHSRYVYDMTNSLAECSARCQELTNENSRLKRELEEKNRSLFYRKKTELKTIQSKKDVFPTELYKKLQSIKAENENLKDQINSLLQEQMDMANKHKDALRLKDYKLAATERQLNKIKTELESIQSRKEVFPTKPYNELQSIKAENENLKDQINSLLQEQMDKTNKHRDALRQKDDELAATERQLKKIETDLSRKESELQDLLHKNQRLQNEITRLNSEKSKQHTEESVLNTIKIELGTKRTEIDSLHERIRQLENMLLQKENVPVSKDGHNLHERNSNAADEVKILQTKVEGKQTEIQRLQDKCALDEKEIQDLQKMCSNVSEERDSLFLRNQHLEDKLNELSAKIRLEENRMENTDEWKHLVEIKDNVEQLRNDNDRLNQNIDTLSKEKDSALSRYYGAEKEVRHLQLDIKSKGEEILRLQKQITEKEGDNEKLQDKLSNISKEKQQLIESNKQQMLLATDESKRWQEKIKEQQNEIRDLRQDLSKQKEDAIKRIRDLESVNANDNDQLLLATDESKRLQGRIKDLQGENSRLRRDIDDLSKQKEDALTRLSKVAGAKLTHGNAAITDLSDTDRPTKLAEKFSELYDNAWTDAFEELDNTFHNEEKTIKVLLRIFQEAYTFCVETENNYETRIELAVFTLASKAGSHQIKNTNVEIQKVLADLRISLSTACCSVIEEMVLSKLPSILKSVDVAACPLTKLFACQCASLSWKMRIRDPPLFVRFEFRCGSTFNADVLKRYTKTGGYLDFLVWPTLYLHENGPVLAKGVAQPKIAP